MSYTGNYQAWIKFFDGTKKTWGGLRKTQAQWRYNWINRNCNYKNEFDGKTFVEFGWKREFV